MAKKNNAASQRLRYVKTPVYEVVVYLVAAVAAPVVERDLESVRPSCERSYQTLHGGAVNSILNRALTYCVRSSLARRRRNHNCLPDRSSNLSNLPKNR